jgi:hypothetical protein
MAELERLKAAGFSEQEIGAYVHRQRQVLSGAGFSEIEINAHFGIKEFKEKPVTDWLKTSLRALNPSPQAGEEEEARPGFKTHKDDPARKEVLPDLGAESTFDKFMEVFKVYDPSSSIGVRIQGEPLPVPEIGKAVTQGAQTSVTGMLARGKLPEQLIKTDMRFMPTEERLAMQAATLIGDIPFMAAGALIGGSGGPVTATGGAFALPAGLRQVLVDKYSKGEVQDFADFWGRLGSAVKETLKGEATGIATGVAGKLAAPLGLRVPAEIATMTSVGAALEGHVPEPQEFLDAALLIGGARLSVATAAKLRRTYAETGVRPSQVFKDAQKDPTIAQDLMSSNKDIPSAYLKSEGSGKFSRRPLEPGAVEVEKPVKRTEISKFIQDKFNVPIRQGRFRGSKNVRGIFKWKPEVIRERLAQDLETEFHELGHKLHKQLWKELSDKPFEKFRAELGPIASIPKDPSLKLTEGFAEFVRLYVSHPEKAKEVAPKFYKAFEKALKKESPQVYENLMETQGMFDKWIKQAPEMHVLAQIFKDDTNFAQRVREKVNFKEVYTHMVDDLYPLKRIVKEMKGGVDLPTAKDPYKLARLFRGVYGKAEHFLEHSPFTFQTKQNVGKSLKSILKPVGKDLDEFRVYAVSKRVVEKSKQGIETGIHPDIAKINVKKYESKYGKVFKELQQYQDHLLVYLRDSGLISKDSYQAMKQMNKDYVPFYRAMETQKGGVAKKGFEAQDPIKKMLGSAREINDPLESIIKNTYYFMQLAEKNAIGKSIVALANKRGGMGKYVEKIPMSLQKITIKNAELLATLDRYGKIVRKISVKERKRKFETKDVRGVKDGESSKHLSKIEERVFEALTSRGWTEGEARQIMSRIKNGENAKEVQTTIQETIKKTKTVKIEDKFELNLPEDALEIFRTSAFQPKDNVISVWLNGKRQLFQVDKDIARVFQALDQQQANLLIKILGAPAKWLRAGAILSPDFIARNPIRDAFSAMVFSKYGFVPGTHLVRGLFELAKLGKGKKSQYYNDWLKSGGTHSMLVSMDRRYLQKRLGDLVQKIPVFNVIKNPIEGLRILSELSEAGTRLGEFKMARKAGKSLEEAGFDSREVTLDFARKGVYGKVLNQIIAFWNANVQGTDKLIRSFKERPIPTTAKAVAGITIPSILLNLANREDPRWKEIPRWQKDLFWIIMTDNHIFRIPKPFELGIIFGTIPERIMEFVLDKEPKAFEGVLEAVGRGAAPGIIPTAMVPLIENYANRSLFLDRPLIPADREGILPEYQYKPYTTELAKKMGRVLGSIPGLKRNKNIAPVKIENMISGWTGGLGMYLLRAADLGLRKSGALPDDKVKPTKTLADMPIIKAFVVRHPSASAESIKRFYDNYFEAKEILDTRNVLLRKDFQYDQALELIEQQSIKLDGIYKSLKNAHKYIGLIYANKNMTPDDKRQLIDAAYYQMIKMANAGNKIVKETRSKEK